MPLEKSYLLARVVLAATALWTMSRATGQSMPSQSEPAEIILSPFVVNADSDVGYAAQNTLAGSRLNTALKDVASPLEVFTKEFLDDIGAISVTDALLYHSNAQEDLGDENRGMQQDYKAQAQTPDRFVVRGQQQTLARDYFNFNIPQDLFSTERIDASRGPNSILFGIGNAGGVTNTQSKVARLRKNATSFEVQAGNQGYTRFTIDHNQPLGENLALRINLLDQRMDGWQVYGRDERTGAQLSAVWQVGRKTRLRADAEYGTKGDYASRTYPVITRADKWIDNGRPIFDPSVVRNNNQIGNAAGGVITGTNIVTGAPVSSRLFNGVANDAADRFHWIDNGQGLFFSSSNRYTMNNTGDRMLTQDEIYGTMINGPSALRDLEYKTFSVFLEHQFTKDFQVELAANTWEHDWRASAFGNEAVLAGEASAFFYRAAPAAQVASGHTATTRVDNPYAGLLYYEDAARPDYRYSDNTNFRLTASYDLRTERLGNHRFAAMLATTEQDRGVVIKEARVLTDGFGNRLTEPENAAYTLFSRHYVTDERNPAEYRNADMRRLPPAVTDPFTGRTFQTGYAVLPGPTTYSESNVDSALISMQNYWLQDRLVTTFGYRYDDSRTVAYGTDELDANGLPTGDIFRDSNYQAIINPNDVDRDVSKTSETTTVGVVFHATDWLSLTYNRSSNAGPPFGGWAAPNVVEPIDTATLSGTGNNEPLAPTGRGEDYGVKLDLLGSRLFITANYFTTKGTGSLTFQDSGFDNRFAEIISGLAGQQVFRNAAELAQVPNGSIGLLQLDSNGRIIETAGGTPSYEVISNLIPAGMPRPSFTARDDDYESTGYELNLVANLSRNLSLRAGYSYTKREVFDTWRMTRIFSEKVREWVSSGRDFDPALLARLPIRRIAALGEVHADSNLLQDTSGRYYLTALDVLDYDVDVGLAQQLDDAQEGFGQRNHKANIWANYRFNQGRLKGLSIFGGVRYASGAEVGYGLFLDENGVPRRDTSRVETNDAQIFNDLGMSYAMNANWIKDGAKLRLQVNVRNVFDDTDYDVARNGTDIFGNTVITRYYVPEPRRISFSARLSF